jgi:hypothetical protein
MMLRFRNLGIWTLFLATACYEPAGPLAMPSTFVVRSINGSDIPAPVISHEVYESVVLADTIHFYPLGVAQRISIYRNTTTGVSTTTTIDTSRAQERFEIRGDSLRFIQYCPPNALCLGAPEGILSADRRQLLLQLWPSGPVASYERVTLESLAATVTPPSGPKN